MKQRGHTNAGRGCPCPVPPPHHVTEVLYLIGSVWQIGAQGRAWPHGEYGAWLSGGGVVLSPPRGVLQPAPWEWGTQHPPICGVGGSLCMWGGLINHPSPPHPTGSQGPARTTRSHWKVRGEGQFWGGGLG